MQLVQRLSLTQRVQVVLLVVFLGAGVAAPYVLPPFYVSILSLSLVFGMFALSINLLAGYAGLVSLGHAGIMATSAYGVGYVASRLGGGVGQQVTTAVIAGLVVTAIFAVMAMRTSAVYFLMVTLAQGMTIWGLSMRLARITGSENGLRGVYRPEAIAPYWKYYYFCLTMVVVAAGLLWVITRSPMGLAMRGLRESETRMRMLGYNTALQKFYAFMLSGVFATASGIMYAYYNQFVSPTAAEFVTSGKGVLMAILGGVGTIAGPLIGAVIIVAIENLLSLYVTRWPTILGLLFIFAMLFWREGVMGAISVTWTKALRRLAPAEAARREHLTVGLDQAAGAPVTADASAGRHTDKTED
jgi:branched-chain amino acid transport system permease protein